MSAESESHGGALQKRRQACRRESSVYLRAEDGSRYIEAAADLPLSLRMCILRSVVYKLLGVF
jgi:hypothetical protein